MLNHPIYHRWTLLLMITFIPKNNLFSNLVFMGTIGFQIQIWQKYLWLHISIWILNHGCHFRQFLKRYFRFQKLQNFDFKNQNDLSFFKNRKNTKTTDFGNILYKFTMEIAHMMIVPPILAFKNKSNRFKVASNNN